MVNLAIIPARGGSKGILMKNMKVLFNKPLVSWTIESAIRSMKIDKVIVSSDNSDILNLALAYGVLFRERPAELAKDNVHAIKVVIDCLNFYEEKGITIDKVAMLLPTSPLRTTEDIDKAFEILENSNATSVVGVCKSDKPESNFRHIKDGILYPIKNVDKFEVQRQDIIDPIYEVNGAMFVAETEHIRKFSSFHMGNPAAYIMNKINSIDINDLDDFRIAEALLWQR